MTEHRFRRRGPVVSWPAVSSIVAGLAAVTCVLLGTAPARAIDEIQVYNAEIAALGQFTIQQHLNYTPQGLKTPPFPGSFPSNGALNGTPEFAYGLTDWWELGLYLPFAVTNNGQVLSDNYKLRTLFVSPHADQRSFFYGINFEFSNPALHFSQTRYALEIRPIIGVRNSEWEFIVNPIVDTSFGRYRETDFVPSARVAYKLQKELDVGLEYYADFGQFGHFGKLSEQGHQLFAVTDFKVGDIDVNFGVGYGLTQASDRWVVKTILGYAFPVAGSSPSGSNANATLVNPTSRSYQRMMAQ